MTRSAAAYGPINDHGHEIPALDLTRIDPSLLRQQVAFAGPYRPGTIVVNIAERRLYLVEPGGVAMRYAVGVGREEALNFRGSAVIGRKAEWPHWTPTADMIQPNADLCALRERAAGRHRQSAGARALYLYRGNQDTDFRLHGTNEPDTIGTKVSSGCIRLFNQDIIDLYNRAKVGTPVIVLQEGNRGPRRGLRPTATTILTDRSPAHTPARPDPTTRDRPAHTPARILGPPMSRRGDHLGDASRSRRQQPL